MTLVAKYGQKILHFYCYTCKAYELKTSPHYRSQKRRFAKRRKAEAAKAAAKQTYIYYIVEGIPARVRGNDLASDEILHPDGTWHRSDSINYWKIAVDGRQVSEDEALNVHKRAAIDS